MDHNQDPASPSSEQLAALELHAQLCALSPAGGDTALRLTVRLADGRYVGDVLLSTRDVAAVNDALVSLNAYRADLEAETAPAAEPLPAPDALPDVDATDLNGMVEALENLANGGK